MDKIDSDLAGSLQTVNSSLAGFFASVITITPYSVVFPGFLFPAVVLGYIYHRLAIRYLNTGRDLRRMESNSRSPIYSDFGELIEGIVTARAFSAENRLLDNLHAQINTDCLMGSCRMTNCWLLLNFDCLVVAFPGGLAVFITALFSITFLDDNAGLAGLAMTDLLASSVERVVEYLKLPQEPPAIMESNRPPAYWPSSAKNDSLLSVEDLVVKYSRAAPCATRHLLHFKSWRVDPVSGKSSSMASIFAPLESTTYGPGCFQQKTTALECMKNAQLKSCTPRYPSP
ncbi:hypothetical protein B0H13DRAFT_1917902 [Mycena leptocephala]|nr:hypothetical protein B0H13DRAFT_1917902 [Mycena leptocephala]